MKKKIQLVASNLLWLTVVYLTLKYSGDLWPFWVCVYLSSIVGRLEEVGDHLNEKFTWLYRWLWEKKKGRIVDGYHIALYAARYMYLWAGALWLFCGGSIVGLVLVFPLQWAVDGLTANLFYHINYRHLHMMEFDMLFHFYNKAYELDRLIDRYGWNVITAEYKVENAGGIFGE